MAIAERDAEVVWEGTLAHGAGRLSSGSGSLDGFEVTWAARTEVPEGKTSPELIVAAHASCFAMALVLGQAEATPERIPVRARCTQKVRFRVGLERSGRGRDRAGAIVGDDLELEWSTPASMGGSGVGTNPEELLVCAVSSCYAATLVGVLRRTSLPAARTASATPIALAAASSPANTAVRCASAPVSQEDQRMLVLGSRASGSTERLGSQRRRAVAGLPCPGNDA